MTEQQKEFIHLCVVEPTDFKTIAQKLNVPRSTLTIWYEELKEERTKISDLRNLWNRKGIDIPFIEFHKWHLSQAKKCFFCEITEEKIKQLLEGGKLATKRIATRGRKLELDRKEPDLHYDDFENIVFACYWCNNAKTDTFTSDEFLEVGKVSKKIWETRLSEL